MAKSAPRKKPTKAAQARRAAGVEPRRPLSRPRQPRAQVGPGERRNADASRSRPTSRASSRRWRPGRTPARRWPRRSSATRRSTTRSAGVMLLCLAASMPATPPIRCAPSSTATCRSASPPPRCTCCSSRSSSTASTTPRSTPRWRDPALGHYRPWIEDVRKEKPYQLEDRVEQLFHEKSVTGYSAWNRQLRRDHRGLALQDRRQAALDRAGAQSAAGRRRREAQGGGAGAGQDLQGRTCGRSR